MRRAPLGSAYQRKGQDITRLLAENPHFLKVAYVDQTPAAPPMAANATAGAASECPGAGTRRGLAGSDGGGGGGGWQPRFWSVLVRWDRTAPNGRGGSGALVECCRVALPGEPVRLVGEAKANNQNAALPFVRGQAVQAVDMNQDLSLEDAVKMRVVHECFDDHTKVRDSNTACTHSS